MQLPETMEERGAQPTALHRLSTPGVTTGHGLPMDLVKTAINRLGFLGLVVAVMGPSAYLVEYFTQPQRVANLPARLAMATFLVAGTAVCTLAWSHKVRAELMLDLGLLFQVLVAFAAALSESATGWPTDHPIQGISWVCLWIAIYVVAIPGTYGKSVLAAVASACMVPFGMLVAHVVNASPMPTPGQMATLLLPPFVAAAWAIPAGRYLYRLSAQVSKARALGSYELIELVGKGGMGEVWRARHRMLARDSAIKLIRPKALGIENLDSAQVMLRRFEREARATAALHSPHTVALFDYGLSEDGSFYYVMELLDGLDLDALTARFGPQPAGRVVSVLRQAAKSLAEAHEQGLVHRDIKPRNVFLCRMGTDYDFVKVLDFGLVKIRASGETQTLLTQSGVTTGTPAYMAPEVALGNPDVDGRADLYSLGCVGYWLLTGKLVFESPTAMGMVLAHVQTPPVPPSLRTEMHIPASLDRLILKCLEKDTNKRPSTARELLEALDACSDVPEWAPLQAESWWRTHIPPSPTASAAASGG